MCAWIKAVFFQLFPVPETVSSKVFREQTLENPLYTSIYEKLEKATAGAGFETQKLFGDYARKYVSDQQDMTASVISRAQALLVSQTLLGALLALVTALMGHTEVVDGRTIYVLVILLVYSIIQVLLLTLNALRSTAGLSVTYPGVSPLIKWVTEGERLLEKNMGLAFIKTYWDLNISNSWRVSHYSLAQRCLRNIIIALAALIFVVLFAVLNARTNSPGETPPYELIYSTHS